MISRSAVVAAVLLLLTFAGVARSANACAVGFDAKTSGFKLNPLLDSLTVLSAKPKTASDTCVLQVGDEILQVNQQPVPGARALDVRKYWKSLKTGAPVKFRVKRAGSVITVSGT